MHKKVLTGVALSVMTSSMLLAGGKGTVQPDVEPIAIPVAEEIVVPEVSVGTESIDTGASRLYNVGLTAGTLGAGINVATPINENFQVRFNINGAKYDTTETEEDIEYDVDLKFANAGVLVDYFPFESVGFHLTAGAYYNANKIDGEGRPMDGTTFTIDDVDYQASQIGSLDATLDFDKFAPYVGLGWGNDSRSEGFGLSLDIGVLVGQTKVDLAATRGVVDDTTWDAIQTSVTNEQAALDDDLDRLKIYPVVMLGFTYTF